MKLLFFLASIILLTPITAWAAPSIFGVSGSLTQGNSVTVSGSGFGTGPTNIVWTGNIIESTAIGDLPRSGSWSSWDRDDDSSCCKSPEISAAQAHSGTKSIWSMHGSGNNGSADNYDSGFWLDWRDKFGSDYSSIFISRWERWSENGATPPWQWKILRLLPYNYSNGIYSDNIGQIYFNYFPSNTGWSDMNFKSDLGHTDWCSSCGSQSYDDWVEGNIREAVWARDDLYLMPETNDASNNGYFIHEVYDGEGHRYTPHNVSGNGNFGTISRGYVIFQNYFGNLSGGMRNANFYIDDIYMADSQARIEMCDASNWSNRSHCEIQPRITWNAGSINFSFNTGSFTSGQQAYLYVVDSSGAVNASGYPVTVGGGGQTDTTPPAAPTGLAVR